MVDITIIQYTVNLLLHFLQIPHNRAPFLPFLLFFIWYLYSCLLIRKGVVSDGYIFVLGYLLWYFLFAIDDGLCGWEGCDMWLMSSSSFGCAGLIYFSFVLGITPPVGLIGTKLPIHNKPASQAGI